MRARTVAAASLAGVASAGSYWAVALAASSPGRRLVGSALLSGVMTDRAAVALTFDDGPDPGYTPQFVEALAGAPSTFFVLGERLRRWPEVGRDAVAAGHELASHGNSHRRLTRLSPGATLDDMRRGRDAIEGSTGQRPRFYRPPHGLFNLAAWLYAPRLGMRRTLWTTSSRDWDAAATPASIARRVLDAARPGAIFLLHDSGGRFDRPSATLEAIPAILGGLRDRGLQPVTLSELVASGSS